MKLFYNDKDIYNNIDLRSADMTINSGGIFDSITVELNNSENDWSIWNPKKGDSLKLSQDGLNSGAMYIDTIRQKESKVLLKALPISLTVKEKHTKSWENVTLFELLNEFAIRYNLELKTYQIKNYKYTRVNQINEGDLAFLSRRCEIEGYVLKIYDNSLIVFDEQYMEQNDSIFIHKDEVKGNFEYTTREIYKGVRIKYQDIDYTYSLDRVDGPILTITDIYVSSIAEAQRFAKNILRNINKYQNILEFEIKMRVDISACSIVVFEGAGIADGKYFVYQAMNSLANDTSLLKLRRI